MDTVLHRLRQRIDAQAAVLVAMLAAAAGIAAAGWVAPGVVIARGGLQPVAIATFCLLAVHLARAGSIHAAGVHRLTIASVVAGNVLVWCVQDPVLRVLSAGWLAMIAMFMSSSMPRRVVLGYLAVCAAGACWHVASAPSVLLDSGAGSRGGGAPADAAAAVVEVVAASAVVVGLRMAAVVGVVVLPLVYLLGMRAELDAALRAARELAATDVLTGLWNRRGLAQQAPQVLALAQRRAARVAVLCVDLDHFKQLNDTHGHAAGDAALMAVASRLRGCLRAGDVVARIGGEELVVLSVVADGAEAVAVGQRLRAEVAAAGRAWALSASVGIAVAVDDVSVDQGLAVEGGEVRSVPRLPQAPRAGVLPSPTTRRARRRIVRARTAPEGPVRVVAGTASTALHDSAPQELAGWLQEMVARADAALYEAKAAGRDRVVMAA